MSTTEPSKWSTALGASADANTLPQNTPAGTGLASLSGLFPQITQIPLDSGGIAPERADFNALFKLLGDTAFFLMQGGVFTYSSSYDYRVGDRVMYNGGLYRCIQAHSAGTANPSNASYWSAIASAGDIPTKTSQLQNDSDFITSSSLPTVNNGTLTIQQDGTTVGTFTANQAGNSTANIAISEINSQGGGGGYGWVRFKSGLQIVFDAGSADQVINFPVAFNANPRLVMTSPTTDGTYVGVPGWYERTTTYLKGNVYDPIHHEFITGGNFDFIAIGFWK